MTAAVHVIDDEEQIRRLVWLALDAEGYQVETYDSAEAYEQSVDSASPHVLIVDKNLPGIDGLQLVRKLRDADRLFEAIMITGFADEASETEAGQLGFYRFIRKPFVLSELRETVAGAIDRLSSRSIRS